MNERMNTTYLGLFASIYYIFTTYFIQKYFVVDTDIIRHPATLLYTYTTHCCIEKLLSVPPPAPMSKICQQIGCSCDWFSHFFSCMKAFSVVTLTMSRPGDQHLTFDPLLPSDWRLNVTTHYWHFPGISTLNFASRRL